MTGLRAAVALLGVLTLAVRGRVARAALVANLFVLAFYAVIEPVDVLLDATIGGAPFLLWAEFNYGVPLLVFLLAAFLASRRAPA